ncbi:MAG: YfiR family protein [Dongiaceae bacterium]
MRGFASRATRLILALAVGLLSAPTTQAQEANEHLVKAAFIYNFAKFTTWPSESFPDPTAPITLCIVGKHDFGTAFDSVAGKSVGGRAVSVKYLGSLKAQDQCHVIFIARSEHARLPKIVKANQKVQALTVSDMDGFIEEGGMIRLIHEPDDRISFEINPKSAEESGLKLSSRLLSLAKRIVN